MARGRHAKKIDSVHWTYGSWSIGAMSAGTQGASVLNAQHLPETLLRIRGENVVYVDATAAPGTLAAITSGLILVPEGTSSTVLWSPITDGDAPWIWWDSVIVGHEEMVTDVIAVQEMLGARRVIDNKAMRRIRNQEVQFVVENATLLGAESVNVFGAARFLSGQS